jgi:gliding motility-associated lipoprotein GldH
MIFTKWLTGCILLLCSFCEGKTLYTAQKKLIDSTWDRQAPCEFNISIQDTDQAYDLYLVLQYRPDFPYQNLHITYQLQNDHGKLISTALTNHLLFDPKTGKPLGKGWGKKKCLQLPLITNYHFEKPGGYKLALVQFMRTEQLTGIASVGIQLCKSQPKTD